MYDCYINEIKTNFIYISKIIKIYTIHYTIIVTFCVPIFFQHKKIISNLIVKLSTLYGIYFISMDFFLYGTIKIFAILSFLLNGSTLKIFSLWSTKINVRRKVCIELEYTYRTIYYVM